MKMHVGELRDLLAASLPSSSDADTAPPNAARLFTPDTHRRALDADVTLVRGGRGVGKTVWFVSLQEDQLRQLAAKTYNLPRLADRVRVVPGYGTQLAPRKYPTPSRLGGLLEKFDSEAIWRAVCLHALRPSPSDSTAEWHDRVAEIAGNPTRFEDVIAELDEESAADGNTSLVLFDALDRMSASASATQSLIEGLLKTALELRTRTRFIRAKIFARPDLVDSPLRFVDASKLTANAVDLTWTVENLYGLLFTLVANAGAVAANNFRAETGVWDEVQEQVWRSPRLSGDGSAQSSLFDELAGRYMGANHRRGATYSWLPNHLSDGRGQVSPRSFLSAIRQAVDDTRGSRAGHPFAMHYDSIKGGVQYASSIRVAEIGEDIPWVETAIKPLRGQQVPILRETVFEIWESAGIADHLDVGKLGNDDVRVGPRAGARLDSLVDELIALGVITVRADRRLDLPDVYRVAFGLGRKGGVPRVER